MIPTDKKQRREMITYMLKACTDNLDDLTSWEESFIESVNEQFQNRNDLSDRQCEILEKIYDKL